MLGQTVLVSVTVTWFPSIFTYFSETKFCVLPLGLSPELCLWLLSHILPHSWQSIRKIEWFLHGELQPFLQHVLLYSLVPVKPFLHLWGVNDPLFRSVSWLIETGIFFFLSFPADGNCGFIFHTAGSVFCIASKGISSSKHISGKSLIS